MKFAGYYKHTIDDNGRFIVPAKYRDAVKGLKVKEPFVMTYNARGSISMYIASVWEEMIGPPKPATFVDGVLVEEVYPEVFAMGIDSQGRATIEERLRNLAGITRNITLVGQQNRVEIWDTNRYDADYARRHPNKDVSGESR